MLPQTFEEDRRLYWAASALAVFLGFNILFNWVGAVLTNPGTPETAVFQRAVDAPRRDNFELLWNVCRQNGGGAKPPRSHYCHVTNRLVLNMDHYCPWVFNTVGYRNYRYFVLMMGWLWVGPFSHAFSHYLIIGFSWSF